MLVRAVEPNYWEISQIRFVTTMEPACVYLFMWHIIQNMRKKTVYIFLTFIIATVILYVFLSLNNKSTVLYGKNLDIQLKFWMGSELGIRDSWVFTFENNGEDLHDCKIILNEEYESYVNNLYINTGFLDSFNKKLYSDIFKKNKSIRIMDTSDLSQNGFFVNAEGIGYPSKIFPKRIDIECNEGGDYWEL